MRMCELPRIPNRSFTLANILMLRVVDEFRDSFADWQLLRRPLLLLLTPRSLTDGLAFAGIPAKPCDEGMSDGFMISRFTNGRLIGAR